MYQMIATRAAVKRLMEIAIEVKGIEREDFLIPNAIFDILFDWFLAGRGEELGLSVELETSDFGGNVRRDAYYDLLVMVNEDRRLRIPLPLVSRDALVQAFKRGIEIVHREELSFEELLPIWVRDGEELSRLREEAEKILKQNLEEVLKSPCTTLLIRSES